MSILPSPRDRDIYPGIFFDQDRGIISSPANRCSVPEILEVFEKEFLFVRRLAGFILKLDQQSVIFTVVRRRQADDMRNAGSHSLRDHSFCNRLEAQIPLGTTKIELSTGNAR